MTFGQGINSITQAFMEMLDRAEQLFGKRNNDWTFVGIEFRNGGPFINYYNENKVSIVLSSNCSNLFPSSPQLYFQLAHETCHLLYPTGKADANVLNEGVSTYFSKIYQEEKYPSSTYAIDCIIVESKYFEAFQLVEKLIGSDKDSIKKIRQLNSNISYITEAELLSLNFNMSREEIKRLASKFYTIE